MNSRQRKSLQQHLSQEWNLPSDEECSYKDKETKLEALRHTCEECTLCSLSKSATNLVFGVGNSNATCMIIGEAPGADEDYLGEPFVGRAGKLLVQTIQNLGLQKQDFYITNILKHRPPENRNPESHEIEVCVPYLIRQIKIINPTVIITLGNFSTQFILDTKTGITKLRGKIQVSQFNIPVIPTFHPAAILRNNNNLPFFEQDLKFAIEYASKLSKES